MKFESQSQKQVFEKVQVWIKELFGEMAGTHSEIPSFGLPLGSAFVQVNVLPWTDDDAVITTRSYVVQGADPTPELMLFLLQQNDSMRFGAFGMDSDKDVFFEHTIVGSTCDKDELKASVLAVGFTADQYDDKIRDRWGGMRAVDLRK